MEYLNYEGLKHYHSKVKQLVDERIDTVTELKKYKAGENIVINDNTITAVIPEDELITNSQINALFLGAHYTVDLNGQWELSTTIPNPDSGVYDGVYQSFAHKGQDSTIDIMYIDIIGYETFKLYIRSNGESSYDYVVVSKLDTALSTASNSSHSSVYAHTDDKATSNTSINGYTLVEFTNIDGGAHRISVGYYKDSSQNSNDDRGYVLIPKNQ